MAEILSYPLIAMIMSVHGESRTEHFLEAVASVKMQTYPASLIHIYLGVDGPIGHDLEEAINFRKTDFQLISKSVENMGLAATLNRLITHTAQYEYVARMDSDDVCLPNRLLVQIDYLMKNADVDILGGGIQEFFEGQKFQAPRIYPKSGRVLGLIARGSPLAHPSVIFRKRALEVLKAYPASKTNEDIALWFKALKSGLVIDNVEEVVLDYRVTPATFKRRGKDKAWDEFKVYFFGLVAMKQFPQLVFPLARLIYRLMPPFFLKYIFSSVRLRNKFLK